MAQIQKVLAEQYFTDLTQLLPAGTTVHTPQGTVSHTRGRASSVMIEAPRGQIDFSQDMDGEAMTGTITRMREPAHDDERDDLIIETVPFPETEGDIAFMRGIVEHLRENRPDQVA